MTLRAQLTAALAGSTSQAPISTETLAQGHSLRSVKAALTELYQERQVCCCEFFKGNNKPVVQWWLAGNASSPMVYNKATKRAKARAKARLEADDE